jgi:hypothetical protein
VLASFHFHLYLRAFVRCAPAALCRACAAESGNARQDARNGAGEALSVLCDTLATGTGEAALAAAETLHSILVHFPGAAGALSSHGVDYAAATASERYTWSPMLSHAVTRLFIRMDPSRNMLSGDAPESTMYM